MEETTEVVPNKDKFQQWIEIQLKKEIKKPENEGNQQTNQQTYQVPDGIFVITGKNGSGKSRLLEKLKEKNNSKCISMNFNSNNIDIKNSPELQDSKKSENYKKYDNFLDDASRSDNSKELVIEFIKFLVQRENISNFKNLSEKIKKISSEIEIVESNTDSAIEIKLAPYDINDNLKLNIKLRNQLIQSDFFRLLYHLHNEYKKNFEIQDFFEYLNGMTADDLSNTKNVMNYLYSIRPSYIEELSKFLVDKFKYQISDNNFFDKVHVSIKFKNIINPENDIEYKDLSSGERFIFMSLIWKFLSKQKIKISDEKIFLLLDEPDSHLEQSAIEKLMKIYKEDVVKNFKISVIMTTHNVMTINFFEYEQSSNIYYVEMINKDEFILKNYNYNHGAQLLTDNLYLSMKRNHSNPKLFEDLIMELNKTFDKVDGKAIENLIKFYMKDEENSKKFGVKYLSINDHTTQSFNEVTDLYDKEGDISSKIQNDNTIYQFWPHNDRNACFDFLIIFGETVYFYQITIAKDTADEKFKKCIINNNYNKFDETKLTKFEKNYEDFIKKIINPNKYKVKYILICYNNENKSDFPYDDSKSNFTITTNKPSRFETIKLTDLGEIFNSKLLKEYDYSKIQNIVDDVATQPAKRKRGRPKKSSNLKRIQEV